MASHETDTDECMEAIGFGCVNEEFKEIKEVIELIDSLKNVYTDQIATETVVEKFTCKLALLFWDISHSLFSLTRVILLFVIGQHLIDPKHF